MSKFRSFIYRFMYGRYGVDSMYWWLLGGAAVFWILHSVLYFFGLTALSLTLRIISSFLLVYAVFRALSKNKVKRSLENRKFSVFTSKITKSFSLLKSKYRDRNVAVYKKCPHCKSTLRLPKKKGEHTVRCPRCNERFDVKI